MRSDEHIYVSVVVPVYGGVDALSELASRLEKSLRGAGLTYEIILVDDRGDSRAWEVIGAICETSPSVRGIRLTRNFGQHAATICGMLEAGGDYIVTMDDDLEHLPEAVPALLSACDENHPLVYGTFSSRTHSPIRNLSSEVMRRTLKSAFPDLNESYTSFRAMTANLAKRLSDFEISKPYIDGMLSWLTQSVQTIEVSHGERRHGTSAYTFRKLVSHAANIFITFSHLPLRIAAYLGTAIALLSFSYMVYIIFARFTGQLDNPGYASLMSVVLFACGVQLIILGVVGEYIGRLMGAANKRPVFAIDRQTGPPIHGMVSESTR